MGTRVRLAMSERIALEKGALYLGSELKHLRQRSTRLIETTVPHTRTQDQIYRLTDAVEVRSLVEDSLFCAVNDVHPRPNEVGNVHDGGDNFRAAVPLINVFYGACACDACVKTLQDKRGWPTVQRRSKQLTHAEIDGFVRLRAGLCLWAAQAKRFVAGVDGSSRRGRPSRPFAMRTRTAKLIDKMQQRSRNLLGVRLRASRASVHWAVVRVAVKTWAIACFLYERKMGPAYAPDGRAARRSASEALGAVNAAAER